MGFDGKIGGGYKEGMSGPLDLLSTPESHATTKHFGN
jgi:hypothetical protein